MDPNTIQFYGMIITSFVGITSIVISVLTLKQNSKMIEESTRPVISIYGEMTNFSTPQHYIVIKNFGQTSATISKFDYDFDFMLNDGYASRDPKRDYLKDLLGATIAPGQSKICALNYSRINLPITFSISYKSTNENKPKTYNENITVNLKAGVAMLTSKSDSRADGESLKNISYTLQEMVHKNL